MGGMPAGRPRVRRPRTPVAAAARSLLAVAVVAIAASLAAGCGGASGGDGNTAPQPSADRAAADTACARPYAADSPWNTPIPAGAKLVDRPLGIDGPLTSNPSQYTYPVYLVTASTPRRTATVSGWFSNVVDGGTRLVNQRAGTVELPIPADAEAAAGSDAQIILIDRTTGDEWGASHLAKDGDGFSVWNAYHYSTTWSGVPPADAEGRPFFPRGAGVPYLTGLVRPCEIRRGRIDHALAFAYDWPSAEHVYPATKSDGAGSSEALPEGTRLQLDPALTAADLRGRGCTGPCLTIARALQRYGMYVIDNSGHPKVMLEYEGTAGWNGLVGEGTVKPIPMSAFRVVAPEPAR